MKSLGAIPSISVVMPIYNAESYLVLAIESVLNQTFKDFELLLLDDGSSDNSSAIIEHYVNRDKRCRSFHWANRGLIATLNTGIAESKADIIFRMDQDDICKANRFEKQILFLAENPDVVAVGARVVLIDPEGMPICNFSEHVSHQEIDVAHLDGKGGAITHPSVAMRKNAVLQVGGYRREFLHAEDIDLFLRLAEKGKLANLPDVLLEYRQHPNSTGYKHADLQQNSARLAVLEAKHRRGLVNDEVTTDRQDSFSKGETPSGIHCKWGWWALSAGNLQTARKHAFQALKKNPFNVENLKLIFCVLRGY